MLGARWPEHHHPAAAPGCFFLPRGPSRGRACVRPCVHAAPPQSIPPPLPSQCPPQIQSCDRIPSWPGPLPCLACSAWRRTDLHAKYTAVMRAIAAPAFRHEEGIIVSWLAVANLVRALFFCGIAPHLFGFRSLSLFHRELRCALFCGSLLLRLIFCL